MTDIKNLTVEGYIKMVNKWHKQNKKKPISSWNVFDETDDGDHREITCIKYWGDEDA